MQAQASAGYIIPADIDATKLPTAGAIAWWRLSGSVDHEQLTTAWTEAGLDAEHLPLPPTPEQGIRRALKEQEEKRLMARPLKAKGSFALVQEKLVIGHNGGSGDLEYETVFRVKVDLTGKITFDPDAHSSGNLVLAATQERVRADYLRHVSALSHGDISSWLVDLAYRVRAVSLRDSGGIYFVPAPQLEQWHKIVTVLRSVSSHQMFEVPALKSTEAVDAILDAISTEALEEIAKLEAALENEEMGQRGLYNRSDRAKAMLEKLKSYEALLGRGAANINERLESLSVELATAALAAGEG
jgi:hypothetical protein